MNEFTTMFELTPAGLRASALSHFAISIGLVAGGIVGAVLCRRVKERAGFFLVMVVLGLGWCVFHMNLFLFAAYEVKGEPQVAEGPVVVHAMQPYHGHTSGDRVTVGGQTFVVDYFHDTPGYSQTVAHGGALRGGVYARLQHYNGVIIKVEVRTKPGDQQPPSQQRR